MVSHMKSSLDIAQEAKPQPIEKIAELLGLTKDDIELYGKYVAKIPLNLIKKPSNSKKGKYILVTAVTPTKYGEGKTTTAIGLTQALAKLGYNVVCTLRQPSLGPVFGIKGGATGAGYSQVIPMEEINLGLTGDFFAIESAHNLLAAMLDNHIHQGNQLRISLRSGDIFWRRVMDMNERALRNIIVALGGPKNGIPRESGFDITAASELMAVVALTTGIDDLKQRINRIWVAKSENGEIITPKHLKASGAMAVLLRNALKPNLVQTIEGQPVLIHAGPFANIAHGANSILADYFALSHADYVVTEAGFGTDLGAEKFFNIKCRQAGLSPDAVVLVVSLRALKAHHVKHTTKLPDMFKEGIENLEKHIENIKIHGLPVVVAINKFPDDDVTELNYIKEISLEKGADAVAISEVAAKGGEGGIDLANAVIAATQKPSTLKFLYPLDISYRKKIEIIATKIYGADGVKFTEQAERQLDLFDEKLPNAMVCMAKTPLSLSDNPTLKGRPKNFEVTIHEIRPSAGAGFIYPISGSILTMPGLPSIPAAERIDITADGKIIGLR